MGFRRWMTCFAMAAAWLALLPAQAQETPAKPPAGEIHSLVLVADPTAAGRAGSVQFIGTATVLLRYGGLTILTDPNFLHKGDHVHLGYCRYQTNQRTGRSCCGRAK
jgi:hypothetical protein